ncbi:hypothetical protein Q5752_001407 [Cryptotrichosporon argae]
MSDHLASFGLTALPADATKTPPATTSPRAVPIADLLPPTTPLSARIDAYTACALSPDTYRHSLRVYSYGRAIASTCFPQFGLAPGSALDETWFVTAMLHDIGTTDANIAATRLSYEFWAGCHALDVLQYTAATGGEGVASRDQAESVAEAIIRHQDVQDKGAITVLTRLIHLGTLLDNVGAGAELIHPDTIAAIVEKYPRPGWCGCFRATVKMEKQLKPYAMVSRIEGFEQAIEANSQSGATGVYDRA